MPNSIEEIARGLTEAEKEIASLRSERAMLVAALEYLDSYARRATFGGWRHFIADVTGTALQRSLECAASRRLALRTHLQSRQP